MSKFINYLLILSVIIISVFLTQCGLGTDTGNPKVNGAAEFSCDFCFVSGTDGMIEQGDDGQGSPPADFGQTLTETGTVLFAICGKVSECFTGVEDLSCIEGVYQHVLTLLAFGVNTTLYSDFEAVQTAIDDGTLNVSEASVQTCENAVDALTCSDLTDVNAFDENTPTDFTDVYKAVPDSECGNVF